MDNKVYNKAFKSWTTMTPATYQTMDDSHANSKTLKSLAIMSTTKSSSHGKQCLEPPTKIMAVNVWNKLKSRTTMLRVKNWNRGKQCLELRTIHGYNCLDILLWATSSRTIDRNHEYTYLQSYSETMDNSVRKYTSKQKLNESYLELVAKICRNNH